MKVFLSWSKPKSKEIANATKTFLEGMFRDQIEIWMSSESITYGSMSMVDINKALKSSEKCLVFLTEDNINSPWIMYEAGAIASRNYLENNKNEDAVVPILFDIIPGEKFHGHPLNQFQRLKFEKETMKKLVIQFNETTKSFSNEQLLFNQFSLNWTTLNKSVSSVLKKYSNKIRSSVTCEHLVSILEKEKFPSPDRGPIIKFDSGFETQKLYGVLLSNAEKRLFFFGRKNRKLYSAENRSFFSSLKKRISKGFDFKCLFINPNCENAKKAQRGLNFRRQLETCLNESKEMLTASGINPEEVCRLYSCERTDEIIIIDNAVLYSHITYAIDEYPLPLTKSPFYILDIDSPIGQKYLDKFNSTWNTSDSLL